MLNSEHIKYLWIEAVDLHGFPIVKIVPKKEYPRFLSEGIPFSGYLFGHKGRDLPTLYAKPDREPIVLPWQPDTLRFGCLLFQNDGRPYPKCMRHQLKRMIDRLEAFGLSLHIGFEVEFYLHNKRSVFDFLRPWLRHHLSSFYSTFWDLLISQRMLTDILGHFQSVGIDIRGVHPEDGALQYEVILPHMKAIEAADDVLLARMLIKKVTSQYRADATFMPQPPNQEFPSGLHLNFHLSDCKTGENVFADTDDVLGFNLSQIGYRFLAGIVKHAPALRALSSPTINCYKRLKRFVDLPFSDSVITIAKESRKHWFRVPRVGVIEDRTISSACNPYLLLTAYIAAGLDGIQNCQADCFALEENPLRLSVAIGLMPASLREALIALQQDPVITDGLGEIVDDFIKAKQDEISNYELEVTEWESESYLQL